MKTIRKCDFNITSCERMIDFMYFDGNELKVKALKGCVIFST